MNSSRVESHFLKSTASLPEAARAHPHLFKLEVLLSNEKLPDSDRRKIEEVTLPRYREWVAAMDSLTCEGDDKVTELVNLLNAYKRHLELDVVWDSEGVFLYRQRGQLKLDGSVLEEFLPRLADPAIIPALAGKEYMAGPRKAFAAAYFATSLGGGELGAGLTLRTKDQDFTVGREAHIRSSFDSTFPAAATLTQPVYLAFVAAECKTNLDKTMFQEAVATAHDLRMAIPGARYYLICEWLDMTPIETATTDVSEVLVLRGKRMGSNKRGHATVAKRREARDAYVKFLDENPIRRHVIQRLVDHMRDLFDRPPLDPAEAVRRGYF